MTATNAPLFFFFGFSFSLPLSLFECRCLCHSLVEFVLLDTFNFHVLFSFMNQTWVSPWFTLVLPRWLYSGSVLVIYFLNCVKQKNEPNMDLVGATNVANYFFQ